MAFSRIAKVYHQVSQTSPDNPHFLDTFPALSDFREMVSYLDDWDQKYLCSERQGLDNFYFLDTSINVNHANVFCHQFMCLSYVKTAYIYTVLIIGINTVYFLSIVTEI